MKTSLVEKQYCLSITIHVHNNTFKQQKLKLNLPVTVYNVPRNNQRFIHFMEASTIQMNSCYQIHNICILKEYLTIVINCCMAIRISEHSNIQWDFKNVSCYDDEELDLTLLMKMASYNILVSIGYNHFQCWHTHRKVYIRHAVIYKVYERH